MLYVNTIKYKTCVCISNTDIIYISVSYIFCTLLNPSGMVCNADVRQ